MPTLRRKFARLILAGAILALSIFLFSFYYYRSPGPLTEPTTVVFKKGMGFEEIVDSMAQNGIIHFPFLFKAIAVLQGDARKFNAGEYEFTASISPKLVMDIIAEGRVVVRHLTIPEGLKSAEVIAMLGQIPALDGEITGTIQEGALLPETYHYNYGDLRQDMLQRMQEGMEATLAELWPKRQEGSPIRSIEEALVLASIVEKETGVESERPRVAAVFINRLNKGMKLQSDPTVIYGIEKEKGELTRALVRSDLNFDSPYNTYKYEGLPPSPIANPGRAALEAVLNPPETKELYFVATGSGGHHFSETIKQHNDFVKQYRDVLKDKEKEKEKEKTKPKK